MIFPPKCGVVQIDVNSTDEDESVVRIKPESCLSPPPPPLPKEICVRTKLKVLSATKHKEMG